MLSATGTAAPIASHGTPTFLPHEAHATTESGLRMHLRKRVIAGRLHTGM